MCEAAFSSFIGFESFVIAWVNDEGSLHTYGRKTDAYKILGKCSMGGNPPDDWLSVLQACQNDGKEHP
ncbi:type II toxin-antitoxin system YhaV family toxin [Citrobacter amalonaticus]|uniref:Type II toxin-antitoxin system YhaV family toxin n=1 Tax=Citrobacter amalonaticus TaxID=35703 RepID=A0A8I0MJ93_CITAM|nr:type II toxin-antitoxin system YhaV family toxin [Citrobacter amalonaticus]